MLRTRSTALLLTLAVAACYTPGQPPRPVPDRQVITQDEIAQTRAMDAYEVIHSLRGNFLVSRGPTSLLGTSSPYPTVYVDGLRFGDISMLRTISASQISTIRLYRSWEAMTSFGNGNMGGVIAITTRLGR
jgi:outer membrane cobalamin receptor